MASTTTVKTIGTTGKFSTPQLWEDGAPANLTTAERSNATTFLVAAFVQGENLTFVGSGATGKFLDTDSTGAGNGSYVTYGLITGDVAANDVCTGATSGATCVITSGTPNFTGVIWQGQCQNQEFSGTGVQLTISGSTSSSTAYKEATTATGASFRDNANKQTNALKYNASNGAAIKGTSSGTITLSIAENSSRVTGLQVVGTNTTSRAISFGDTNTGLVSFCISESANTTNSATGGGVGRSGSATWANTLFVQRATGAAAILATSSGSPQFYNCTLAAPDDLATAPTEIFLSGASGTVTVQNCGLFAGDSTKAIKAGSATFTFTTCYSDISGTTGVTQATYSSEFQNVNDATRDFRLKGTAAQVDHGTTDSTNAAADIIGTARPQGSAYDVGAWEQIVFSATGALALRHATIASTAAESFSATGALALRHATLSGTATETFSATGALALRHVSIAATDTESEPSTGALALPHAILSGTATESEPSTGALAFSHATLDGTGTSTASGAASTGALALPHAILSGTATESEPSAGALTLDHARIAGAASETASASGALALAHARVAGAAAESITSTGSLAFAHMRLAGSETGQATADGVLDATEPQDRASFIARARTRPGRLQPGGSGIERIATGRLSAIEPQDAARFEAIIFNPAKFFATEASDVASFSLSSILEATSRMREAGDRASMVGEFNLWSDYDAAIMELP